MTKPPWLLMKIEWNSEVGIRPSESTWTTAVLAEASTPTVRNAPIAMLGRLGLARAYAMQGDTAKAKIAYLNFLTAWKDADPETPVFQEAKAEFARLQ